MTFYRTWNILVQDWLYLYVYKDTYILFKSRILSIGLVFILSAVLHDYIMISFGFFYPVCTVMFGLIGSKILMLGSILKLKQLIHFFFFLVVFVFLPKLENSYILGNISFWILHVFGFGVMNTLYISEYYSRLNCPSHIVSISLFILNFL